ncbi:hypothetical protein MRX96_005023 [Rhipicephalus microplus]
MASHGSSSAEQKELVSAETPLRFRRPVQGGTESSRRLGSALYTFLLHPVFTTRGEAHLYDKSLICALFYTSAGAGNAIAHPVLPMSSFTRAIKGVHWKPRSRLRTRSESVPRFSPL